MWLCIIVMMPDRLRNGSPIERPKFVTVVVRWERLVTEMETMSIVGTPAPTISRWPQYPLRRTRVEALATYRATRAADREPIPDTQSATEPQFTPDWVSG